MLSSFTFKYFKKKNFCISYNLFRCYYTGKPFRFKSLSSFEVSEKLDKRGIKPKSSFQGRVDLLTILQNEMNTGKMSIEEATSIMSFQDLQTNLKIRNANTNGPGKDLRKRLCEILKKEENNENIILKDDKQQIKLKDDNITTKGDILTNKTNQSLNDNKFVEEKKNDKQSISTSESSKEKEKTSISSSSSKDISYNKEYEKYIHHYTDEEREIQEAILVEEIKNKNSTNTKSSSSFTIYDIPNPRENKYYISSISDNAGIFNSSFTDQIENKCDEFQEDLGNEIAIVTLNKLPIGYKTTKSCATDLFNNWGIGNKITNDGLLFLLVISERRLEIEIGEGLNNTFKDNWLQDMQYKKIIPHFKKKNFGNGVLEGLNCLYDYLDKPIPNANNHTSTVFYTVALALVVTALAFTLKPEKVYCDNCDNRIYQIELQLTDLNKIQRKELSLGNCSFTKYSCDTCGKQNIVRKIKKSYGKCIKCNNYTRESTTTIIEAATTSKVGTKKRHTTCGICGYDNITYITIPKREVSTHTSRRSSSGGYSSGGGSSGSYGGGSSSGGGSGSSW